MSTLIKFSLLLLASAALCGCRTSEVAGQPRLHIPIPGGTNSFRPPGNITNYFRTERVIPSPSNNINAYIQIASDQDVAEEFGPTFSSCFYVGEVVIENRNSNAFLAYSSSLEVNVAYYLSESDWKKNPELQLLMRHRFNKEYILSHRRASTYSDILAIFEYQRQTNPKQQFINYLKSAGEIAAGATIFIGGATYPKAVAFATGIVTTELEKRLLWDIVLHAKNLESRSLKEVEEIPAFGSIHRLVFFPKRGIPGIVDSFLVYISSFTAKQPVLISGSLIEKTGPASSGKLETDTSE